MKNLIPLITLSIILVQCKNYVKEPNNSHNKEFHFVTESISEMKSSYSVYVPTYSKLYHQHGVKFSLTTTLTIRNTNIKDSIYLFNVDYYNSKGEIIEMYIDSTLLLTPLETYELIVEENEDLEGIGTNFLVKWGAKQTNINKPIIQAIAIGTFNQQGVSFKTEGVGIK